RRACSIRRGEGKLKMVLRSRSVLRAILACLACGCGQSQAESLLANPGQIPSTSSAGSVSAEFFYADARWAGSPPDASLHLTLHMKSKPQDPTVIPLQKCLHSYDTGTLGKEIAVSLLNAPGGQPTDKLGFPPRGELEGQVWVGGQGVFPHESVGKAL